MLVIDNDLRTITIPDDEKVFGVYSDDNVKTLTFQMPRYYNGIDLSEFVIRVNYRNSVRVTDASYAENIVVESELIYFDWVLRRNVFNTNGTSGSVTFSVCLRLIDGDTVAREFNTTTAVGIVLPGIEKDSSSDSTPEVISQIEIWAIQVQGAVGDVEAYATSAANSANISTAQAVTASNSANVAQTAETNTQGYASQALRYRNEAEEFRNEAAQYAGAATYSHSVDSEGYLCLNYMEETE